MLKQINCNYSKSKELNKNKEKNYKKNYWTYEKVAVNKNVLRPDVNELTDRTDLRYSGSLFHSWWAFELPCPVWFWEQWVHPSQMTWAVSYDFGYEQIRKVFWAQDHSVCCRLGVGF